MKAKKEKRDWIGYLLFLAGAVAFVLFFSTSSSPLYRGYGADSAIFQVIGKYWAQGRVPYLELFDHKGPYIFLVDAVGYGMMGGKSGGIALLQCIHLFLFLLGAYEIALCFFEKGAATLWTMLTLGFLALSYEGGNLTEEYMLPYLAFSVCGQLRFFKKGENGKWEGHPYGWAFLYGVTFALCVFTRLTNAVGLCCGIFIILCILIREKKWRNIAGNVLAAAAGTAVAGIPFLVYFLRKGALYEMFLGTIWQNVRAAVNVDAYWWSAPHSIVGWIHIIVAHFCSYGLILAGIAALWKKRKEEAAYWLFVGVCMTAYLMTRKAFYHYSMITALYLPAIAAVCTEGITAAGAGRPVAAGAHRASAVWEGKAAGAEKGKGRNWLRMALAAFVGLFFLYQAYTVYRDFWGKAKEPEYASLLQEIPKEGLDAFVAYNVKTDIYLLYDIEPCYRYFHHQDAHAAVNEALRKEIQKEYSGGEAEWILFMETDFENSIEEILKKDYECVAKKNEYTLYGKRE